MPSPREIKAAVRQVVLSSLGARTDEVVTAVLHMLGFESSSVLLRQFVRTAPSALLARDGSTSTNGLLQVPIERHEEAKTR